VIGRLSQEGLASARCSAAERPSFFSARKVARDRVEERAVEFAERACWTSRWACFRVAGLV
jgi:hypothetical protein